MEAASEQAKSTFGGLNQKTIIAAVLVIIALAALWYYMKCQKAKKNAPSNKAAAAAAPPSSKATDKPVIYGTMGCPYTVKQLEKYPDHEFVDCSAGQCPSFVTAYPTTKWPDGRIEVGFS